MKQIKIVLFVVLFMAFGIVSPLYAQTGLSGTGKTMSASLLGQTLAPSEREPSGMDELTAGEEESAEQGAIEAEEDGGDNFVREVASAE